MRTPVSLLSLTARYLAALSVGAAIIYYSIMREADVFFEVLLAVGVLALVTLIIVHPHEIRRAIGGRRAKYGSNLAIILLAFAIILGLVNFVTARHPQRWDLTAGQQFTLSDQTLGILQRLPGDVQVKAFYAQSDPTGSSDKQQAEDLLKAYQARTDKIKYQVIDPDQKPTLAQQYGVGPSGMVVFEMNGKSQQVTSATEQEFTGALLKLESDKTKKIGFLQGHGETGIDDSAETGYSGIKSYLEHDNYDVVTVNLSTEITATQGLDVLVIVAPQKPLMDNEKTAIEDYLKSGGKALILADPKVDVGLNDLLTTWGVKFQQGVVIEPQQALQGDPRVPVVTSYGGSSITSKLSETVFPLATSIEVPQQPITDVTVTKLVETTDNSWLETDQQQIQNDPSKDPQGPLAIAVSVEAPAQATDQGTSSVTQTRLVLVGNAAFADNTWGQAISNADLFLNSVNWLAQSEELISISPKQTTNEQMYLTATQMNMTLVTTAGLLPLIVLVIGVSVWWRRR